MSEENMIKTSYLESKGKLPLLIEPGSEDVDLIRWARSNPELLKDSLSEHGGILFRGFNIEDAAGFSALVMAVTPELMEYFEPSTRRTKVEEKVYTSTEYPADQEIPLHNELSYSHNWPTKIWFYCAQPAQQGGETPICDSRKVFQYLDTAIRQQFLEKKVMYVRHYGDGFGLPWPKVFGTTNKAEVESYCRRAGIEFLWRDGERLTTRQVREAVIRHPLTGETVWFNQAHVHNILAVPEQLRDTIIAMAGNKDFPLDINTCYGDATPIEASALEAIKEAYRKATVVFPWRYKDVLLLDNQLVAHGRRPFSGPRRILVAMAEPLSNSPHRLCCIKQGDDSAGNLDL
jgi:alpha-ketoglutarate-dependent taurine dioxygenase